MICSPKNENIFSLVCPLQTQSSVMISKSLVWFKGWLKHWKGLKLKVKLSFLDYNKRFFGLKISFWKNSSYFNIYLKDFFLVILLYCSPYKYVKLLCYKRVKWGRLAGPSLMSSNYINLKLTDFLLKLCAYIFQALLYGFTSGIEFIILLIIQ